MVATLQTRRSGATQHPEEMFSFVENRDILVSGVGSFDDNHFLVEQSDTPALSVDVRDDGIAWITNSTNTITYPVRMYDGDNTLSITANSSGNDRYDAVVLYIDLGASPDTTATNVAKFLVIEGTPAASPVVPTDAEIQTAVGASNPFLRLADVLVQDSASSITDADITDTRVDAKRNHSLSGKVGGWTPLGYTMTYASATTVTVDGVDITSQLSVGMKLKLTQPTDGVKYFYITGFSFSTDTTITITAGNDYDMDNEAIYQPYISTESAPVGFPGWFNYTPTYGGGGSLTFTSVTTKRGEFKMDGKAVTVGVTAVGTTGGSDHNSISFTLPVTASAGASNEIQGGAATRENASSRLVGFYLSVSTTVIYVRKYDEANWGLSTNRGFGVEFTYKAA